MAKAHQPKRHINYQFEHRRRRGRRNENRTFVDVLFRINLIEFCIQSVFGTFFVWKKKFVWMEWNLFNLLVVPMPTHRCILQHSIVVAPDHKQQPMPFTVVSNDTTQFAYAADRRTHFTNRLNRLHISTTPLHSVPIIRAMLFNYPN